MYLMTGALRHAQSYQPEYKPLCQTSLKQIQTTTALTVEDFSIEMPSFAKKYTEQDTAAIVAYLKTLH
jgi:mono/diheme cytochrome c family protein